MRLVFSFIILLSHNLSFAQTGKVTIQNPVFNGATMVGDKNTMNVYPDVRLTVEMTKEIENYILKLKQDSNFLYIKNFEVNLALTSNGAALKVDLIKYFMSKGFKYVGNERKIVVTNELVEKMYIDLRKQDSCLVFLIGVM